MSESTVQLERDYPAEQREFLGRMWSEIGQFAAGSHDSGIDVSRHLRLRIAATGVFDAKVDLRSPIEVVASHGALAVVNRLALQLARDLVAYHRGKEVPTAGTSSDTVQLSLPVELDSVNDFTAYGRMMPGLAEYPELFAFVFQTLFRDAIRLLLAHELAHCIFGHAGWAAHTTAGAPALRRQSIQELRQACEFEADLWAVQALHRTISSEVRQHGGPNKRHAVLATILSPRVVEMATDTMPGVQGANTMLFWPRTMAASSILYCAQIAREDGVSPSAYRSAMERLTYTVDYSHFLQCVDNAKLEYLGSHEVLGHEAAVASAVRTAATFRDIMPIDPTVGRELRADAKVLLRTMRKHFRIEDESGQNFDMDGLVDYLTWRTAVHDTLCALHSLIDNLHLRPLPLATNRPQLHMLFSLVGRP